MKKKELIESILSDMIEFGDFQRTLCKAVWSGWQESCKDAGIESEDEVLDIMYELNYDISLDT
jgi:hypothetical protein